MAQTSRIYIGYRPWPDIYQGPQTTPKVRRPHELGHSMHKFPTDVIKGIKWVWLELCTAKWFVWMRRGRPTSSTLRHPSGELRNSAFNIVDWLLKTFPFLHFPRTGNAPAVLYYPAMRVKGVSRRVSLWEFSDVVKHRRLHDYLNRYTKRSLACNIVKNERQEVKIPSDLSKL